MIDLEPKLVWQCFDEITRVPRPTHHLEKMKEFLVGWADKHGITVRTDEVGNVMMSKPATPGHENAPTIILQGHQDMVAEKRGDKVHDFLTDPITTIVDGDWVKADGTTLGADNGLGCASAMAVLLDDSIVHGPIECLFTVDEEQGLIGPMAFNRDSWRAQFFLILTLRSMARWSLDVLEEKSPSASFLIQRRMRPTDTPIIRCT